MNEKKSGRKFPSKLDSVMKLSLQSGKKVWFIVRKMKITLLLLLPHFEYLLKMSDTVTD